MNKVSSKLAAGVRKVKAQQKPAPAAPMPSRRETAEPAVQNAKRPDSRAGAPDKFPSRIWPD